MSSFYSPKYSRINFMQWYPFLVGKGKSRKYINVLDRLDTRYLEIIKKANEFTTYKVKPGDNLPNISWSFYQTTTLWWVIARVNGIIDPLSIKANDVLFIPSFNSINTNISVADTSNIGTVTKI